MLKQVLNNIYRKPSGKNLSFIKAIGVLCLGSLALLIIVIPFLQPTTKPEMFYQDVGSIPVPPVGYPATISFKTASNQYQVGETFGVDVIIDTGGTDAIGADVFFAYNPSKMQVNNISESGIMFTNYPQMDNTIISPNDGRISIGGYSLDQPFNGKGEFATVTFTAVSEGLTNLSFYFTEPGRTEDSNVSAFSATLVGEGQERDLLGGISDLELLLTTLQSPLPSLLPSPSPSPLSCYYNADLNLDGIVDTTDLSIMVLRWGEKNLPFGCRTDAQGRSVPNEDLNSDSTVNSIDVQVFVPQYNPQK